MENVSKFDSTTKVEIKKSNFFFNKEKFFNMNVFFRFYLNYIEIIRALNKSFFYFYIKADFIHAKMKTICEKFESLIVNEMYGSMIYLLMRSDTIFLENFEIYLLKNKFFRIDLEP